MGKDRRTPQGDGRKPRRVDRRPERRAPHDPAKPEAGDARRPPRRTASPGTGPPGRCSLRTSFRTPTQPRKEFDPGAIERLAESIKAKGLLQPLRVRWNPALGKHVILVGERRYRAATPAGLTSVPCIFVETS